MPINFEATNSLEDRVELLRYRIEIFLNEHDLDHFPSEMEAKDLYYMIKNYYSMKNELKVRFDYETSNGVMNPRLEAQLGMFGIEVLPCSCHNQPLPSFKLIRLPCNHIMCEKMINEKTIMIECICCSEVFKKVDDGRWIQ
jgi:hypothetical protein